MNIKAVIFDMDGLMFDTEKFWIEKGPFLVEQLGYDVDLDIIRNTIGTTYENEKKIFQNKYGKNFPIDKLHDNYRKHLLETIKKHGTPLKKGILELLEYLKNNNYKIAIASSSDVKRILFYLEKANIDIEIFDVILGGENVVNGKPNPEGFLKTIEKLHVQPEETIILEDSNNGIKAAYRSNCIPILIPDLDIIEEENKKLAYKKFDSLLDVIKFLDIQ